MKNLVFESILLISHIERKARKVIFDPKLNVIQGSNDTGKSTILKSLYYGLGAEIKIHERIKRAKITIIIRFCVDQEKYMIIRRADTFSLYNSQEQLIGVYNKVTTELAPALAKLFSFNLTIRPRYSEVPVIPPPAFMYLAYYLDQDRGWNIAWNSFEGLGQFTNWRKRVANYHVGVKPDKWYELESLRAEYKSQSDEPTRKLHVLRNIAHTTAEQITKHKLDYDIEQFREEIQILIKKLNSIKNVEDKYRSNIQNLHESRISLEKQISVLSSTIVELNKDYKYAVDKLDLYVNCPTCGAEHENSLSERFRIANDSETCSELLNELKSDHISIVNRIQREEDALEPLTDELLSLRNEISSKEGMVQLQDIIELAGKNCLLEQLDQEISALNAKLDDLSTNSEIVSDEMKLYTDVARRKKVMSEYSSIFRQNCIDLRLSIVDESIFSNVCPSFNESGSDLPRLILAYFFTVIKLARDNDSSTICPIVVDAPKQQEQDTNNYPAVLEFLKSKRPEEQQMIVGLVDSGGVDLGGQTTVLSEEFSVMTSEYYPEAAAELQRFELDRLQD